VRITRLSCLGVAALAAGARRWPCVRGHLGQLAERRRLHPGRAAGGEWAQEFPVFYGVKVSYAPVGSQAGLNRLSSGGVDFAATDSPLTTTQLQACPHCGQIPWALTAIGLGYHVSGAGNKLRLSPSVLAKIYLGQITQWNDGRITALNPGVLPPALRITPLSANASGDTYVFTQYLSRVSAAWRAKVVTGDTVSFPAGLSTNGNAGVTALLQSTNGAIGYVGAAYLITHRLPAAAIQNAAGNYEYPNLANITAAAARVRSVPANGAGQVFGEGWTSRPSRRPSPPPTGAPRAPSPPRSSGGTRERGALPRSRPAGQGFTCRWCA
jgi:phosphate ABC transporter phosphate-binding protein